MRTYTYTHMCLASLPKPGVHSIMKQSSFKLEPCSNITLRLLSYLAQSFLYSQWRAVSLFFHLVYHNPGTKSFLGSLTGLRKPPQYIYKNMRYFIHFTFCWWHLSRNPLFCPNGTGGFQAQEYRVHRGICLGPYFLDSFFAGSHTWLFLHVLPMLEFHVCQKEFFFTLHL